MNKAKNVDEYIIGFPQETQVKLDMMRRLILESAPDCQECISYGMPAYKLRGKPLVYFGGYDKHIGFYATPTGHSAFEEEFSKYKTGKGSVQFPLSEPLPIDLILKVIKFRIAENLAKQ